MEFETEAISGTKCRERTLSSMSQQSSQSSKWNFPDSGLYTCSSNNSDCSAAALESDSDSSHIKTRAGVGKDDALQLALRDARRLRSELERLTKSEQWYKQELRQQKTIRLDDLERLYTQERKFMQDNQRLQNECVRLYEKCSEFERELQKQNQESGKIIVQHKDGESMDGELKQFEVEHQSALIKDQQELISVLRKQKKSLLNDLRALTEEKDEKVMEMQRVLADLEFDNKRITKRCAELSTERSKLESDIKQVDSKLSTALSEKLSLQKSLVALKEQLEIQEELVKLKEDEIAQLQEDFKENMRHEHDLDKVHKLSMKYHEEINSKSLEIITLKSQLSSMQDELENLQEIQAQNDQQQRLIEQLNFSLEACQLELQEMKQSELIKSSQIQNLQETTDKLLKDKEEKHTQMLRQQRDFENVCRELKITNEQYTLVQERYKETQFKLQLLEIDHSKLQFKSESDQQEIQDLRKKLRDYLQQTAELGDKIRRLEADMKNVLHENLIIKTEFEKLQQELETLKQESNLTKNTNDQEEFSKNFVQLSEECKKLQSTLDAHSAISSVASNIIQNYSPPNIERSSSRSFSSNNQDKDILDQLIKLQENTDLLEFFQKEKRNIIIAINSAQQSNEGMEKLVNENEILKKKIFRVENEAYALQLKQEINEQSEKCTTLETLLDQQEQKVKKLQCQLLQNDSKLYKMSRQLKILQETKNENQLQLENQQLKFDLEKEQQLKTDLSAQLTQVIGQMETLNESLERYKSMEKPTSHKGVQCSIELTEDVHNEVKYLKEQILDLQNKQHEYAESESQKQDERLKILRKLSDIQNSKVQYLQESKQEWEDMLKSLNTAQVMEEQTRRELELKRLELEELNNVFAEQNEELRKLEEMTALIEFKRQQEKENLKKAFQHEICGMKQQLCEFQDELRQQQELNDQLKQKNDRIEKDYHEDYATEIADHKAEVRTLKNQIFRSLSEKDEMLERIRELEGELRQIKLNQREAVLLEQFPALTETFVDETTSDVSVLKSKVDEDHLRILTKVLEAEYARKMQRYDEHIHSLLMNVNSLKKSLKLNEERTAILSDEQSKTMEELKEMQKVKINLEDMRLKYEQSQNTIKELKEALILERKKFESSDLGKSSRNEITTYEVSNLIDDYKKLIQQSALVTKRPSNNAIIELVQRSNQYVPNLQKLEANIGDLRCDLQNFLSTHAQKVPLTSLITTASLTVPPSLMDELRAASDGF